MPAAYTGMRWGELAGLDRTNVRLADNLIRIDPDIGALHEVSGKFTLGPPKTAASARDVHLPPFLTGLLRELTDSHDHHLVFTGERGAYLRRSSMSRRVWRPAADGDPRTGTAPHRSSTGCTSTTYATATRPGSSKTTSPNSPRPAGSATAYPASTATSTPAMQRRITQVLQDRLTTSQPPAARRRHLHAA